MQQGQSRPRKISTRGIIRDLRLDESHVFDCAKLRSIKTTCYEMAAALDRKYITSLDRDARTFTVKRVK
jgi:hypothetical protein